MWQTMPFVRLLNGYRTRRACSASAHRRTLHMTNGLSTELRAARSDAPRLSVTTPLPEMIESLNAYQPEMLITYPRSFAGLRKCSETAGSGSRPGSSPPWRDLALVTWGAQVLNVYGSTRPI